jgi:hypothetical protein
MTQQQAIAMTDGIIKGLDPKECSDLICTEVVQYYVARKYPEIHGWYYNKECTLFCSDVLSKAIVIAAIEYCSPKQTV